MQKIITITVDSTEENSLIETHLKKFVSENFQNYQTAKINIENVFMCSICKENQLIPIPVNMPVESFYCHYCNKSWKKEEVEK